MPKRKTLLTIKRQKSGTGITLRREDLIKLISKINHRQLLTKSIVLMIIIFISFSTYNFIIKTKRIIHRQDPVNWYPRYEKLVENTDRFLWSLIETDDLYLSFENRDPTESFVPYQSNKQEIKVPPNGNSTFDKKRENPIIFCPETPPKLKGWQEVSDALIKDPPLLSKIENRYPRCRGATYKPHKCKARHRVAIIIPLRGRELQLRSMLAHMHTIWQRQQMDYTVYTITQAGDELFNRGKLMNVGFAEAVKDRKYDCFVFHDVDLLLENDKCLYWCPQSSEDGRVKGPRHISTYVDKFDYKRSSYTLGFCSPMSYKNMNIELFGGVTMFTEDQFISVNGFSNLYWGWGAEDDDLFMRTFKKGYKVQQDTNTACSYHMINHERESRNREHAVRFILLKHALARQAKDGLSNLQYKVLSRQRSSIYTNITVDIGTPSPRLRNMISIIANEMENDITKFSCFDGLVWMHNKLRGGIFGAERST